VQILNSAALSRLLALSKEIGGPVEIQSHHIHNALKHQHVVIKLISLSRRPGPKALEPLFEATNLAIDDVKVSATPLRS
jgi:hypothetical protein